MALIQLVTECKPLKDVPLEYNTMCWHCNLDRVITPHPEPLVQSGTLEFLDYRPTVSKPYKKKPQKQIVKGSVLKSFPNNNMNTTSTKHKMDNDIYSRQRMFMHTFGIDILVREQLVYFHRVMKDFMIELDYTPTDKQDVILFYNQESYQDIYDVYLARRDKTIKTYAHVFDINFAHFDDVLDFMHLIRCYISDDPINMKRLMNFFKENDPQNVYLDIKMKNLAI